MKRFVQFAALSAVILLAWLAFSPAPAAPSEVQTLKPFTPAPRFEEPTPAKVIVLVREVEVETQPRLTPFTTPRNDAPNATNVFVGGHDNASVVHVHNGHNITTVNNIYRKRTTDLPIDRTETATATVKPAKYKTADRCDPVLLAEHNRTVAKWNSEW